MLPIKVTAGAAAQIQKAAKWWSANRPKAPDAFQEELRRGLHAHFATAKHRRDSN